MGFFDTMLKAMEAIQSVVQSIDKVVKVGKQIRNQTEVDQANRTEIENSSHEARAKAARKR